MLRKLSLIVLFILIGAFMFSVSSDEDFNKEFSAELKIARVKLNQDINDQPVPGYVFFNGFDFENYSSESEGIEKMLEVTLELLQAKYKESKQPFVFVGHSQGGLRSLAMSTYLKRNDPELYKQLKGVITLSGIDKGLKLLENNGANFRSALYNDVRILTNGVYGTIKVLDFSPFNPIADFIFGETIKSAINISSWELASHLLGSVFEKTNGFAYPIMYNREWDSHAQVRDMVPQSKVIQKYVLTEQPVYRQHKSEQESYTVWEWRKGWLGIRYPVYVTKYKPKIIVTNNVTMKVDKNLSYTFLAGTNSDTLSLADSSTASTVKTGLTHARNTFRTAQHLHYAKCAFIFGFFTNSIAYSVDCQKAANWCRDYNSEISELIGDDTHDGLVALSSQYLPTKSLENSIEEKTVLNNALLYKYPSFNHATINFGDSQSKIYAETKVKHLLGQ